MGYLVGVLWICSNRLKEAKSIRLHLDKVLFMLYMEKVKLP